MLTAVVWELNWLDVFDGGWDWSPLDDTISAQMEDALVNSTARTVTITPHPWKATGTAKFDLHSMTLDGHNVRRSYNDPSIAVEFFYLEGPEWVKYDGYSSTLMRDVLKAGRTCTVLYTHVGRFLIEFDSVDRGIVGIQYSSMRSRAVRMKGYLKSTSSDAEKNVKAIEDDPAMPKEF
eukprot:514048-Prymnesium_polylepis.1